MAVHLIAPEALLSTLAPATRARADCVAAEALDEARWPEVERGLAAGDALIAIGTAPLAWLRPLWVDATDCPAGPLYAPDPAPLPLPALEWRPAAGRGLFIRPPRMHVYFGRDEMPRVALVPLLTACDAMGQACAYPAVWLKHVAASLVGGRFAGGQWFLYAFERPLEALGAAGWTALIDALCAYAAQALAIVDLRTHYACYRAGETALVEIKLANRADEIQAVRLELAVTVPDGERWTTRWLRRTLAAGEEVSVPWEFPVGAQAGLWRVRADLLAEDRFTYGEERYRAACPVERAECGLVVQPGDPATLARPHIGGRALAVEGARGSLAVGLLADGFLAGTHYYPSSSWWDWAWRDFRPARAAEDVATLARLGYRLARVWVDPELDEDALRGLEAWLVLSGMAGIVSLVCVFTQWARHLSYPDEHGMTTFEFMGPADYNVYSVQLTNVEHQQRYLATLGRRWRAFPNVIWNLSNEALVVDPDPGQVDAHAFGDVEPAHGPEAGAAYFNRWADLMTEALRGTGATQPVLRGYGFPAGGDCFLQNRSGDLLVWHDYRPPEVAGPCLAFGQPGMVEKPLLLEEFGIPTFDETARLEHYTALACWAAALGAAGACAYEWGVGWLARELPYVATPLKDMCLLPELDPRWGPPGALPYAESWPVGSVGLCPWAASFCYGSNFGATPFPTPAARALGEIGRFCAAIGAPGGAEPVLLAVPREWGAFAPQAGYERKIEATVESVRALAAAHVPFSVVQEEQLGTLDGQPAAVIVPAVQPLRPETEACLVALAARGVQVHVGSAAASVDALARYAVALESDRPVWLVARRTRAGRLAMLYAPEGAAQVRLELDGQALSLRVERYVLVELGVGVARVWPGGA